MKDSTVVPRYLAEKLKEVGFNELCVHYYLSINGEGSEHPTRTIGPCGNWNVSTTRMSAPTWDQVIEWFNSKHSILIYELPTLNDRGSCFKAMKRSMLKVLGNSDTTFGDTRHEAMSKAFEVAIKLII